MQFAVFLIHQLSENWHKPAAEVYAVLNRTHILDDYIIKCYDMLHTQGSNALVEDITEFARERGVDV